MKTQQTYILTTDELKHAVINYINDHTREDHILASISGFDLIKSSDDIRVFTGYISFEESTVNKD